MRLLYRSSFLETKNWNVWFMKCKGRFRPLKKFGKFGIFSKLSKLSNFPRSTMWKWTSTSRSVLVHFHIVVVVVVSHIQRIGCQPEKTTLHGGQSRSWSAEQGKENKRKSLAAYPPPPTPHTARSEKINKITRRIYRRYAGGRSRVRTRIPSARRLGLWGKHWKVGKFGKHAPAVATLVHSTLPITQQGKTRIGQLNLCRIELPYRQRQQERASRVRRDHKLALRTAFAALILVTTRVVSAAATI